MKECQEHDNRRIDFVCLDKTCKAETCFACFACVRSHHQNCSDETLLELSDFLKYELVFENKEQLSPEVLNQTNRDFRRALDSMRLACLKKKDLLLDFLSLTERDMLENFPRVHALYQDYLFLDRAEVKAGSGSKTRLTVSSKFRFQPQAERYEELVTHVIQDFKGFTRELMDMSDCLDEPLLPDSARLYDFEASKVEVVKVEGKENALEFFSKSGKEEDDFNMDEGFGQSEAKQKDGGKKSKEIVIKSKQPLEEDSDWK